MITPKVMRLVIRCASLRRLAIQYRTRSWREGRSTSGGHPVLLDRGGELAGEHAEGAEDGTGHRRPLAA